MLGAAILVDLLRLPVPPSMERRAWTRYPLGRPFRCRPAEDTAADFWRLAHGADLSRAGISLYLKRRTAPGSLLTLEPLEAARCLDRLLQVRVVYAQKNPRGGWRLGCAFLEPLTADELRRLLRGAPAS